MIDNFYHNVSGPMVSDVSECENNFCVNVQCAKKKEKCVNNDYCAYHSFLVLAKVVASTALAVDVKQK